MVSDEELARWDRLPPPLDGEAPLPADRLPPIIIFDADGIARPGPGWDRLQDSSTVSTPARDTPTESPDRSEKVTRVPVEGADNTPLDPSEVRPRIEWREGDPPLDPGDLRYRDGVVYVRPERRDEREADSGLGRPDSAPDSSLPPDRHQEKIDIQRGNAAQVVGVERWSNSKYAGQMYDKLSPKMKERFPEGVQFSDEGFPMLDRYAAKTVQFEEGFRGPDREDDFKRANAIFGWKDEPRGMTWHHREDGKTMILIDSRIHAIGHWGGVRVSKQMGLWEGQER